MNELALFAGAGGGILGGHLLGWRTVAAVEIEEYPRSILLRRQLDGILPRFPVWDDVCTFDGRPWRGKVDIITGGFPCQDISLAGAGAGIEGERSGLWTEMARIVGEVRPRFVFVENAPALTSRGLGTVCGDLAALGYDARWCVLGAHNAGAPHKRDRIWLLAFPGHGGRGDVGIAQGRAGFQGQRAADSDPAGRSGSESPTMADPREVRFDAGRAEQSLQGTRMAGQASMADPDSGGRCGRSGDQWQGRRTELEDRRVRWWDIDPADLPDAERFGQPTAGDGGQHRAPSEEGEADIAGSGDQVPDTDSGGLPETGAEQLPAGAAGGDPSAVVPDADRPGSQGRRPERGLRKDQEEEQAGGRDRWPAESGLGRRLPDGLALFLDFDRTVEQGDIR